MSARSIAVRATVRRGLEWSFSPVVAALVFLAPTLLFAESLPAASPVHAIQVSPQEKPDSARADTLTLEPILLDPINVTATREAKGIFETAAPVSVVDTTAIRIQKPNNTADLILDLPGIDINGIGANQQRPTIRGQRGQRILMLEDGLRLNNARRQADFGELPAIIDVSKVDRVEVVRGPASVLYGSDAIGGVLNILANEAPPYSAGDGYRGNVSLSYRDQGDQIWPNGEVYGRAGHVGYGVSASYRNTKDYTAASGTFGDISFDDDVTVQESGVEDESYGVYLDYAFNDNQKIMVKGDFYRATDAGFGYVTNQDLGQPDDPFISLFYPDQKVNRYSLAYRGTDLGTAIADRFQFSAAYMQNERTFGQDIDIFDTFGPGTAIRIQNRNYTELKGYGIRAEASKLLLSQHLLTYGLDYYHDDSYNEDLGVTALEFGPPEFVPPVVSTDSVSNVPNAVYERFGAFAQVDLQLTDRVALIVGGRYQKDKATPKPTEGWSSLPESSKNDQFVGAANLLVELIPSLNLVGTVGRGFRSPNLIELFFDGATPEGGGYQVSNPNLDPETSINFDIGLKYRRSNVAFEGFVFQNEISNGIRIAGIPDSTVGPFPAFQSVNVEKIRVKGFEMLVEWQPVVGFTVGGTYTLLDGDDLSPTGADGLDADRNNPIGDSYSNRFTANLGYQQPNGRFWAAWQLRHNGEQKNAGSVIGTQVDRNCGSIAAGGDGSDCTIPSFTVMNLRGGVRLFDYGPTSSSLMVGVENLGDVLYAEFANASFFRPNAGRTLVVSWVTSF
ncbi:MAG: TonB-dependent receptor plug domain-containing protein [Gemmatimonadota bacterium]